MKGRYCSCGQAWRKELKTVRAKWVYVDRFSVQACEVEEFYLRNGSSSTAQTMHEFFGETKTKFRLTIGLESGRAIH